MRAREGTRLAKITAHYSVCCLFDASKVFDKMAERISNLHFGLKLGGFARNILGSLWLVGLVKGHWFGWV